MAIEYIGSITLKVPQHIEDKLALRKESALGEPAYTALLAVVRAAREGCATCAESNMGTQRCNACSIGAALASLDAVEV